MHGVVSRQDTQLACTVPLRRKWGTLHRCSRLHTRPYRCTGRSQTLRCYGAAGFWQQITQAFARAPVRSKALPQRQELEELLSQPAPDGDRVAALVDQLAASRQPFVEEQLGGGPWKVAYTSGPLLWQRITGKLTGPSQASQEYIPNGRRVVNRGSLLGSAGQVTAQGTYELADPEAELRLPLRIRASVSSGALKIFGREIPLPIKGTGETDLLYLDRDLRIFRGVPKLGIAIQMRTK